MGHLYHVELLNNQRVYIYMYYVIVMVFEHPYKIPFHATW